MSTDDNDTTVKSKEKTREDIELELGDMSQDGFDPSEFYDYANSMPPMDLEHHQETALESTDDAKLDSDDATKDLLAAEYIKNITAQMLAGKTSEEQMSPSALINSIEVQSKLNEGKKATSLLEARAAESTHADQEEVERLKAEQEEAARIKAEQEEAERLKAEQEAATTKASVDATQATNTDAQQKAADEAARIKASIQQASQNQSPEDLLKAYVASSSPNKEIKDESQLPPAAKPVEKPTEKPVETPTSTPEELKAQTAVPASVMQPMKVKAAANDNAGLYSSSTPARAKVIPLFPNAQQNRPEEAPTRSPELAVTDKFIHDLAVKRLARTEDKKLAFLMERGKELAMNEAGQTERRDLNNQKRVAAERALGRVESLYNGGRPSPAQPDAATPSNAQQAAQNNQQPASANSSAENGSNEDANADADKDADNPSNEEKNTSLFSVKNNEKTGGMSAQADLNQVGAMLAGMTHGVITGVFSSMSGVGYGVYRTLRHAGIEKRVNLDIEHVKGLEALHKRRDAHAQAVRDHIMAMEKKEAEADAKTAKKDEAKKDEAKKVDLVKHGKEANTAKPASDYQASVDKKDIDLLDCNKLTKSHLNNVYSEYDKFNKNNKALDDKKNPLSEAERVKAKDATRNAFDKYLRNAEGLNNNIGQNLKKGDDGDIAAAGLLSSMNSDMQTNMAKSKKKGNLRSQKNDEKAMSQVMKKTGALLSSLGKALKNAFGSVGKKKSPKA
ncbi:hypothetical protein [uncultured Psychrobacter sp.]|uniref:hypothetical protein n=1 Tax=uncultured Psychrobacter sp. TaxID=259303 RepID=UPI0030DDAFD5